MILAEYRKERDVLVEKNTGQNLCVHRYRDFFFRRRFNREKMNAVGFCKKERNAFKADGFRKQRHLDRWPKKASTRCHANQKRILWIIRFANEDLTKFRCILKEFFQKTSHMYCVKFRKRSLLLFRNRWCDI